MNTSERDAHLIAEQVALITWPKRGAQIADRAAAGERRGYPAPKESEAPRDTVACMHCGAPVGRMVIVCPHCDQPPVRRIIPGINDDGIVRVIHSATAHRMPWAGLASILFYRNHRPTRLGKVVNRSWARVYSWGLLPDFLVTLEVKGRRHHGMHSTALVVAEYNAAQYLVSMLGESADWVKNVRAAHGEAIIRHGRRRRVRLVEVPADQRAPILKAYLERATEARPHFPVDPKAPIEAFERISARDPVFRIEWQE